MARYDYRNCQSLVGYAEAVHQRSGGVCQLCGAGSGDSVDFDLWRQLTMEHLIGQSQGGNLREIRKLLAARYPYLSPDVREDLARRLDEANTVTACSFCNATTSRDRNPEGMAELLGAFEDPEEAVRSAAAKLGLILQSKRADVRWKLESVRAAFEEVIKPGLLRSR